MKSMKRRLGIGLTIVGLSLSIPSRGQGTIGGGTFQDLDFEDATALPRPGGLPFGSAFPGWSGSVNGVAQSSAPYNLISTGAPEIGLMGPNGPSPVVDGNYSALLISSRSLLFPQDVAISQTGTIPTGAQSIQMKVVFDGATPPFVVAMGGSAIPMIPISLNPSYALYGGSVSIFAGKNETLTITVPAPGPGPSGLDMTFVTFDDITFSTLIVPEPPTFALLAVGSLTLGWGLGRQR